MRRTVALHWPTLLVASACSGLALSNWLAVALVPAAVAAGLGVAAVTVRDGSARVVALGATFAVLGLAWGTLRLDALERSALVEEIGSSGVAELVVTAPARPNEWSIRVQAEVRSFRGQPVRERALLVLPVGRSPPRGTILQAVVRVREPRGPETGFDERAWLARQGAHVVLRAESWRALGRRGGVGGFGDRIRDRVVVAVERGTDGVRRGLVLGVVLGEDEGLPADVREDFRASGLYHLLAVSGQNVAFIVGGVYALGWLLRIARGLREALAIGAILGYVLAVGWQPSVVRAGVAGALACLAWLAARPRDRWSFMAWGALVLLAWSPTAVLEPGFQLSFAAVASIFLGVPRARAYAEGYPVPRWTVDVLAVALVCGLATAPIVLFHFDRAPVYTVPANALAFVALPCVLGLGLLAAGAEPISPEAATGLAWLAGWAAAWLELVARLVASFPGAQVGTRTALVVALGVAALVGLLRMVRHAPPAQSRLLAFAAAGAALVVAAGWWAVRPGVAWSPPEGLRVTFLDVGQGDAVLLETPSARVLVDQGPPEADVAGQLTGIGVRSLSAIVLTHPQRDHVGGAAQVLRQLDVGAVLHPGLAVSGPEHEEALVAARARGVAVREVRAGSELRAGGLVLRVLWPPDRGLEGEDPNANAVVLVASYGAVDVFLPADAESDVTGRVRVGDVEILKVAHHGSADPGLPEELRRLRPEIAVVSAGRGNPFGHPSPGTLAALAGVQGLSVYRTDEHGRVVVEAHGRLLRARTGG